MGSHLFKETNKLININKLLNNHMQTDMMDLFLH